MEIQVLDARKESLGEEHPYTIMAMENLGKHTEAEMLQVQALDAKNKIHREEHQDASNKVLGKDNSDAVGTLTNLPTTTNEHDEIIHSQQKGI